EWHSLATLGRHLTRWTHKMSVHWFNWIVTAVVTEKFWRFFFYEFLVGTIFVVSHTYILYVFDFLHLEQVIFFLPSSYVIRASTPWLLQSGHWTHLRISCRS